MAAIAQQARLMAQDRLELIDRDQFVIRCGAINMLKRVELTLINSGAVQHIDQRAQPRLKQAALDDFSLKLSLGSDLRQGAGCAVRRAGDIGFQPHRRLQQG